jgi:small nuclear ribonucleoprotein (snRNP)-like protein
MSSIERPLDLLNKAKGKQVIIYLKSDKQIVGKLVAFDIHINIVLEDTREVNEKGEITKKLGTAFVRGDTILYISPAEV